MIFTLALRNLFHDGIRFAGTLIGIGFSIFLVTVQLGLYLGFSSQISAMIDRTDGDLWIVPKGTKSFEEASALDVSERYIAMAVPGVARSRAVRRRIHGVAAAERGGGDGRHRRDRSRTRPGAVEYRRRKSRRSRASLTASSSTRPISRNSA